MTGILVITGLITSLLVTIGTAVLMAAVAFTDLDDRMRQKVKHWIWW